MTLSDRTKEEVLRTHRYVFKREVVAPPTPTRKFGKFGKASLLRGEGWARSHLQVG